MIRVVMTGGIGGGGFGGGGGEGGRRLGSGGEVVGQRHLDWLS